MILVDIYVPSVDKTYDFQLNEQIPVSMVIEEIGEMIGQKEHATLKGNASDLTLCSYVSRTVLNREKTLEQEGIVTGNRLLLV